MLVVVAAAVAVRVDLAVPALVLEQQPLLEHADAGPLLLLAAVPAASAPAVKASPCMQ